jgi:hypothetical protein
MVVAIVLRTWPLKTLFRKEIWLDDTLVVIASLSLIGSCATSGIEAVLRSLLWRKSITIQIAVDQQNSIKS